MLIEVMVKPFRSWVEAPLDRELSKVSKPGEFPNEEIEPLQERNDQLAQPYPPKFEICGCDQAEALARVKFCYGRLWEEFSASAARSAYHEFGRRRPLFEPPSNRSAQFLLTNNLGRAKSR